MPREAARTKSDTLAGMLEGAETTPGSRGRTLPCCSCGSVTPTRLPATGRDGQCARAGTCPQSRGDGQSSRVLALAAHAYMSLDASSPASSAAPPPTLTAAPDADGGQGFQRTVRVPAASESPRCSAHGIMPRTWLRVLSRRQMRTTTSSSPCPSWTRCRGPFAGCARARRRRAAWSRRLRARRMRSLCSGPWRCARSAGWGASALVRIRAIGQGNWVICNCGN